MSARCPATLFRNRTFFREKLNKAVEIVYVKNNITSHRSIAARADILKNVLRERTPCSYLYH